MAIRLKELATGKIHKVDHAIDAREIMEGGGYVLIDENSLKIQKKPAPPFVPEKEITTVVIPEDDEDGEDGDDLATVDEKDKKIEEVLKKADNELKKMTIKQLVKYGNEGLELNLNDKMRKPDIIALIVEKEESMGG